MTTVTMPLISVFTRKAVIEELGRYGRNPQEYCRQMDIRLKSRSGDGRPNPVIANFLSKIFGLYEDQSKALCMVIFGFMVYRAIEMTFGTERMPEVNDPIKDSIIVSYIGNENPYIDGIIGEVEEGNPQLMLLWFYFFDSDAIPQITDMRKIKKIVLATGMLVYQFIRSQEEADSMKKSFVK